MTPHNTRQFYSVILSFVLSIMSYTVIDWHTNWKWVGALLLATSGYLFIKVWREICREQCGDVLKESLIELVVYVISLHIITFGVYVFAGRLMGLLAGLITIGVFSIRLINLHEK